MRRWKHLSFRITFVTLNVGTSSLSKLYRPRLDTTEPCVSSGPIRFTVQSISNTSTDYRCTCLKFTKHIAYIIGNWQA